MKMIGIPFWLLLRKKRSNLFGFEFLFFGCFFSRSKFQQKVTDEAQHKRSSLVPISTQDSCTFWILNLYFSNRQQIRRIECHYHSTWKRSYQWLWYYKRLQNSSRSSSKNSLTLWYDGVYCKRRKFLSNTIELKSQCITIWYTIQWMKWQSFSFHFNRLPWARLLFGRQIKNGFGSGSSNLLK